MKSKKGRWSNIFKNGTFHVIFDYSATKGDTITVLDEPFTGFFGLTDEFAPYRLFQYVVDSIDTLSVKNMKIKRFFVSGTQDSDWTIGIGSQILENIGIYRGYYGGNIFGSPQRMKVVYGFCDLRCFDDISFVEYPCNNIGEATSINDSQQDSDILFYPSVVLDKLFFTQDFQRATIYNLLGQEQISISPITMEEYSLNQLQQGIYLITIENKHLKKTFTLIKK